MSLIYSVLILWHLAHQQTPARADDIELITKRIVQSSLSKSYSVKIEYPQITKSADKNKDKINEMIQNKIFNELNQFKDRIEIPPQKEYKSEPLNYISINYEITFKSQKIISIVFDINEYDWPAAHPQNYTLCMNLDISDGSVIKLDDLFRPKSNYRQRIVNMCREYFKGKGENPKNLTNWNLIRNGVVINFYRCEILGCSDGKQRVTIPVNKLSDILSPKGKSIFLRS